MNENIEHLKLSLIIEICIFLWIISLYFIQRYQNYKSMIFKALSFIFLFPLLSHFVYKVYTGIISYSDIPIICIIIIGLLFIIKKDILVFSNRIIPFIAFLFLIILILDLYSLSSLNNYYNNKVVNYPLYSNVDTTLWSSYRLTEKEKINNITYDSCYIYVVDKKTYFQPYFGFDQNSIMSYNIFHKYYTKYIIDFDNLTWLRKYK